MEELNNEEWCDPAPGRHCNSTIPRLYGFICNMTQGKSDYYNISDNINHTTLIRCVDCFFPNHCLDNNTCLWGTAGPTCERCLRKGEQGNEKAFYRLGSLCVECTTFPSGLVFFLVVCIALVIATSRLGFSVSVYVKIKLLCNYLQLALLTLNVRILWPGIYATVFKFFTSVNYITEASSPECVFHPRMNLHYFKWLITLTIPVLAAIVFLLLQRSMAKWVRDGVVEDKRVILLSTKQQWQRFSVFLFLLWYSPLLVTAVHCKACSKNTYRNYVLDDNDVFMYDQGTDISCDQVAFQLFTSVCSVYLLLWICVPFVLLFFTLRQQKWHLLTSMVDHYGSFYEPYTERFCFWETVLLLRMMVMILLSEMFLFSPRTQLLVMIGLTVAYLLAVCACRPYRKVAWVCSPVVCIHTTFEVISNVSLLLLQVSGYIVTKVADGYPVALSYAALTLMAVTLLFWSAMFCLFIKETPMKQISKNYHEETPSEQETHLRSSIEGHHSYPGNYSGQGNFSNQGDYSNQESCSSRGKYSNRGKCSSSMLATISQSSWERAAGEHYTPPYPRHSYSSLYADDLRHIHSMPTPHFASKY